MSIVDDFKFEVKLDGPSFTAAFKQIRDAFARLGVSSNEAAAAMRLVGESFGTVQACRPHAVPTIPACRDCGHLQPIGETWLAGPVCPTCCFYCARCNRYGRRLESWRHPSADRALCMDCWAIACRDREQISSAISRLTEPSEPELPARRRGIAIGKLLI